MTDKQLAISEPIVAVFRANVVKGRNGSSDWCDTYQEAELEMAKLLLNAGNGAYAEIEKLYCTQSTIDAFREQEEA